MIKALLGITLVLVAVLILLLADMLPRLEQQLAYNAFLASQPRATLCIKTSAGYACEEQIGTITITRKPAESPAALRGASTL